jgi:hypothetical protein
MPTPHAVWGRADSTIYRVRYERVEESRPNTTWFVFPGSGTAVVDAPLTENGGAIG